MAIDVVILVIVVGGDKIHVRIGKGTLAVLLVEHEFPLVPLIGKSKIVGGFTVVTIHIEIAVSGN